MFSSANHSSCGLAASVAWAMFVAGCALSHRPLADAGRVVDGGDVTGDHVRDGGDACALTVCGSACIDTTSDHANCGACGHACASTDVCSNSVCGTTCTAPRMACGGNCIDVSSDNANCGSCGHACGAGMTCTAGTCGCATGQTNCGGTCVDLATDPAHCGACGTICSGTQFCGGGSCHLACTAPETACAGSCVNLSNSVQNCGACGNVCAFANATPTCSAGSCTLTCLTGFGDCDGDTSNGCETDLRTTVDHCGACGTACTTANGTPACSGGTCAVGACDPGFGDCDGHVPNGCEVALNTLTNCGSCRTACALAHATADCSTGTCTIGTCDANYGDCDAVASNGCETDLRSSMLNCGSCSNSCLPGETCSTSTCQCTSPRAICGSACVDLTTTANCGGCGLACVANSSCMLLSGGSHQCRCNSGYSWCPSVTQCRMTCP